MSPTPHDTADLEMSRQRVNALRTRLADFFVNKAEVIDLMTVCMVAQEPLLLVGKPGTAKSDLVIKFCQAMNLGDGEYFEYMLTQFTEPSEIIGPVDIARLKEGAYFRRIEGKLPTASVVFLDEIFKSNSAILNTLLTIINERKFYQDGRPEPVRMVMLFGAANEIPEFTELGALRDRFALKIKSDPVGDLEFDRLIEKGLRNEANRIFNQRPWQGLATLADFQHLNRRIAELLMQILSEGGAEGLHDPFFPPAVYTWFRRILRTLVREHHLEISDRKIIKLYKLIRTRAFVFRGGTVDADDLRLLRYVPDRLQDFDPVQEKVDRLLEAGY